MVVSYYLGWFITATRDPRALGCARTGWESLDIREGCTKLKRSNALGTSAPRAAIYFPSFANNEVNSWCEQIITSSVPPPILLMPRRILFIRLTALIPIKCSVSDPIKTLFFNISNWLWNPLMKFFLCTFQPFLAFISPFYSSMFDLLENF